MRLVVISFLAALSVSSVSLANGGVKKLGNVIAVEKELTNVYADCMKYFTETPKNPSQEFYCVVPVAQKAADVVVSQGHAFHYKTDKCQVDGEMAPRNVLISFGSPKAAISFEVASSCLSEALASTPMIATMHVVE